MLSIDKRQYEVQKLVDRKETSSYYTDEDGMKVIAMLLEKLNLKGDFSLMDPFMGAGITLSSINRFIKPKRVIGIEINKEPYELAKDILTSIYEDIEVVCGSAFKLGWDYKADLVISNPPFTRWHRVKNRNEILKTVVSKGYGKYISRKDVGLHVLSIFLIDHILNEGGYAILVLPASTFYTSQASGVKSFLKEFYDILYLVENANKPSFSSGSGYKELIVVLRKRRSKEKQHRAVSTHLESNEQTQALKRSENGMEHTITTETYQYDGTLNPLYSVNIYEIKGFLDRNWISLFRYNDAKKLSQFLEEGINQGVLRYLQKDEIMVGIQMLGPEFFFIPNKYWKITKESETVITIRNGKDTIEIPKKYLIKCLRKSEYYMEKTHIDDPKFYILSIDDTPQGDLKRYINWGLEQNIPALSLGKEWYKHIWKQIQTKKPYGHIFLHNKIDLKRHRILANYSSKPLCASKDFFIIKTNNPLIAMWYNSEVMRDFLKIFGRKISSSWTELLVENYLQIPVPADDVDAKELASYVNKWKL
jgi:methylase of polypeptide subunit release factors